MQRIVVLDLETTGVSPLNGDRVIEIGCTEILNGQVSGDYYHEYIHPEMEMESEATEVHGITNEFLRDKPGFSQIALGFLNYISGAELVIHNAPFDLAFLNNELALLKGNGINQSDLTIQLVCPKIVDTLALARELFPGMRCNLDALCERYHIDTTQSMRHGAALDSELLAKIYIEIGR